MCQLCATRAGRAGRAGWAGRAGRLSAREALGVKEDGWGVGCDCPLVDMIFVTQYSESQVLFVCLEVGINLKRPETSFQSELL